MTSLWHCVDNFQVVKNFIKNATKLFPEPCHTRHNQSARICYQFVMFIKIAIMTKCQKAFVSPSNYFHSIVSDCEIPIG